MFFKITHKEKIEKLILLLNQANFIFDQSSLSTEKKQELKKYFEEYKTWMKKLQELIIQKSLITNSLMFLVDELAQANQDEDKWPIKKMENRKATKIINKVTKQAKKIKVFLEDEYYKSLEGTVIKTS